MRIAEYGASSGGLSRTEFPAASAGATVMPMAYTGPFHGMMIPTTPRARE